MSGEIVSVRHMVDDVEGAVGRHTKHLGFSVSTSYPPAFVDAAL